jgi:PAS domain S-box-containing protein
MSDAYGMTKKQLEGIHLDDLHTKEQAQAYYDADLRVINSRKSELNIDEPWDTVNGLRWVNTSKVPYIDQTGNVVGVIGVSMDVTERKKAEEELEVYRKHLEELVDERTSELAKAITNLEQSNKELEEFAYVASHDLQEPLRMVSSYTQLLERRYKDKLDQDANDFINYAVDGANRMQRLINDLLEYSRVSTQGKEFKKIDMSQILGQAVSNLQYLIADNLALVTNEELPVLSIDETQIIRVFQNLIENGIKYKKKTELPKIHISCTKKNHLYEFSVRDNGIGIEMQYHDRIFIIFQRLHKKADYPGTGIGLSVTKRIIERHGGTIWFDSKVDEGTTFYFTLPAN